MCVCVGGGGGVGSNYTYRTNHSMRCSERQGKATQQKDNMTQHKVAQSSHFSYNYWLPEVGLEHMTLTYSLCT